MAASQQPVSAQVVGNAFVQQFYHIQHHSPGLVYRFYQDISKLGRPEHDGSMSITTTMHDINEKILSLNYDELRAEINSVDSQESYSGGVHVLVTGQLIGKDKIVRNFSQTFFLAPQDKGYFVLNDMFRYVLNSDQLDGNQISANTVEAPVAPEQIPPVQENNISERTTSLPEEASGEEVYNPPENGDVSLAENGEVPVLEEEISVAEVVDEVHDGLQIVVVPNSKIEEVPKKSFASIVMDLKESAVPFSSPTSAPRKTVPKTLEQPANPPSETLIASGGLALRSDAVEIGNKEDGGSDGYSIYIRGLPFNATSDQLEEIFKKFGPIRNDGIQVRSNRQQGFCFGFVEFEVASAVQKAIEASPIIIGGRQAFVEEKRSTISRGNTRGRFLTERGSGYRSEGGRGRGNYGGGRGYNRGDMNSRTGFGSWGTGRGGSSNRGGDRYQRTDSMGSNGGGGDRYQRTDSMGSNGGGGDRYQRTDSMGGNSVRMNRGSGMGNGTVKSMAPRVSATA